LGLPHIFMGGGQFQTMLNQACKPACSSHCSFLDEPPGRILQHHRLQREASPLFPSLKQRAAAQRSRASSTCPGEWSTQQSQHLPDAHRLA